MAKNYRLILSLLLWISGKLLHPIPLSPDSEMNAFSVIGIIPTFLFWLNCLLSWGSILAQRAGLKPQLLNHLVLGTVFAVFTITLLGSMGHGLIQSESLMTTLLFAGPLIETSYPFSPSRFFSQKNSYFFWVIAVLLGSSFLLKFLSALVPQLHSDPLMYNLIGPRHWFETGGIRFDTWIVTTLQCSYWEYLHVWANVLLSDHSSNRGIIEAQIFAQLTHVVIGFGGTLLALYELLKTLQFSNIISILSTAAGASCEMLSWTARLAKNDWGISFFAISGIRLLLVIDPKPYFHTIVGGFCLGLAFAGKLSSLFIIFPFLITWVFRERKKTPILVIAFLCSTIPLFLRNFLITGNPVFPALNSMFHSDWLSLSLGREYALLRFENSSYPFLGLLKKRLLYISAHDFILLSLPLIFLIGIWSKKWREKAFLALTAGFGISLFLITMKTASGENDGTLLLRYLGPALILGLAGATSFFFDLISKWKVPFYASSILLLLVLAPQIIGSPSQAIANALGAAEIPHAIRTFALGGETKAWIRLNVKPTDFILSTGDNQVYHISSFNIAVAHEHPYFDRHIETSNTLEDFLEKIKWLSPKYILDTKHFESYYWTKLSFLLAPEVLAHPETILHISKDSWVIDFDKLANSIHPVCSEEFRIY